MEKPTNEEYAPFYRGYVQLVPEPDLLGVLESQVAELGELARSLPPERETFRYAEGKWSVREVLGHVNDAERTFGHRAFRFSRGDRTPLPGTDDPADVAAADYDSQRMGELAEEFALLRRGHLALLRRLNDAQWRLVGEANGSPVSVRALGFIMAGHVRHHLGVLRDRYGVG